MIDIKVLMPKKALFEPGKLSKIVENTLDEAATGIKMEFNRTTLTWSSRPEFKVDAYPGKRIIYTSNEVYRYVSGGTRVRRVVMVPGFRAKSVPGSLRANKGAGGVAFGPSKKIARPGIKARDFDITIQKRWKKQFPAQMQRAIDSAFG